MHLGWLTGKVNPAKSGLVQHNQLLQNLHPTNFAAVSRRRREVTRRQMASVGTVQNLVVMLRFNGHKSRTLPSKDDLGILFNSVGPSDLCPTVCLIRTQPYRLVLVEHTKKTNFEPNKYFKSRGGILKKDPAAIFDRKNPQSLASKFRLSQLPDAHTLAAPPYGTLGNR